MKRNMMSRLTVAAVVLAALCLPVAPAAGQSCMWVHKTDGSRACVEIAAGTRMEIVAGGLRYGSYEWRFDEVSRLTFAVSAGTVQTLAGVVLKPVGDKVYIRCSSGGRPQTSLCSVGGVVQRCQVSEAATGEYVLSLADLAAGVYVLRVNEMSIKILKR